VICAFGFTRKEALGHRSPLPLLLVHCKGALADAETLASRAERERGTTAFRG